MIRTERSRLRRRAPRGPESLEPRRLMAVFTVNSFADILSPPANIVTLRSAIQAANNSSGADTIVIPTAGTYPISTIGTATDNSAGELAIADAGDLTIENTSGGTVTIKGGGLDRVFDVDPAGSAMPFTVTLSGLVITGGHLQAGDGAGVDVHGAANLVLSTCDITGNTSYETSYGGGVAMETGSTGNLTLSSTRVSGNITEVAGGGVAALGSGSVVIGPGSVVNGNVTTGNGGGIYTKGAPLSVVGATVSGNRTLVSGITPGTGGGIENAGAAAVFIYGSLIEDNTAAGDGGGYHDAGLAALTVVNSFLLGNASSTNGGAIEAGGPLINVTNTTLGGNLALYGAGAFLVGTGTARFTDSSFLGNTTLQNGGGIDNSAAKLVITGCTLADNTSTFNNGAGLFSQVTTGDVTISNSLFRGNSAGTIGGGLAVSGGTIEVAASWFTDNSADEYGAASFGGVATISNSTFDGNRSSVIGVVHISMVPGASLTNSTIANNTGGNGLTLDGSATGTLALIDDTIDGNTAPTASYGGGVLQITGTVNVQGTIIARNTAGGAAADYLYSAGNLNDKGGNLLTTTAGSVGKFGSGTIFANPKLGPLTDNGGLTAGAPSSSQIVPTQALYPGSPAFAKGVAAGAPTTDERGFPRAASPSIGAYEPQYASNATPNTIYAENLYEVLFNRPGDAPGVAAAAGYLNGGGTPQGLVQFFQSIDDYVDIEVTNLYRRYFDRAPSASDMTTIAGLLKSGTTPEQVAAAFVGSAEFSQDYGKNNDVFVEGMFQTTLGRTPANPAEFSAWDQAIVGGFPRYTAAANILAGSEYLADLTTADFVAFAGRGPTPAELTAYIGAARAGVPSPTLAAIVLGETFAART